jgi:hypothetical protein
MIDTQDIDHGIWAGHHLDLAHEAAVMIHDTNGSLVQRDIKGSIQLLARSLSFWFAAGLWPGRSPMTASKKPAMNDRI